MKNLTKANGIKPTLIYLENKFGITCNLSGDHTIEKKVIKKINYIPLPDELKKDKRYALNFCLRVCKLIGYKKNLNIDIDLRYELFKERVGKTFEDVYSHDKKRLIGFYCSTYGMDEELAEDYASDAIMQSLQKIELYECDYGSTYLTWLHSIARNLYNGDYEKNKGYSYISMDEYSMNEHNEVTLNDSNTAPYNKEDIMSKQFQCIQNGILNLNGKCRTATYLREIKGYPYEEIREALSDITQDMVNEICNLHTQNYDVDQIYSEIHYEKSYLLISGDEFHTEKTLDEDKIKKVIDIYEDKKPLIYEKIVRRIIYDTVLDACFTHNPNTRNSNLVKFFNKILIPKSILFPNQSIIESEEGSTYKKIKTSEKKLKAIISSYIKKELTLEELMPQLIKTIKSLKNNTYVELKHNKFGIVEDLMTEYNKSQITPVGYNDILREISIEEIQKLIIKHAIENSEGVEDIAMFETYDSLAYNLSTVKSQIKIGRGRLVTKLKSELEEIEEVLYSPFEF